VEIEDEKKSYWIKGGGGWKKEEEEKDNRVHSSSLRSWESKGRKEGKRIEWGVPCQKENQKKTNTDKGTEFLETLEMKRRGRCQAEKL